MIVLSSECSLPKLLAYRLRSNPQYTITLFDNLTQEQRSVLSDLESDPEFYGVLVPLDSAVGSIKAVTKDIALLFLTLNQPALLPKFVQRALPGTYNETIWRLILDRVLEIEIDSEFVSGITASQKLRLQNYYFDGLGSTNLAKLSMSALSYAQTLEIDDPVELSMRLYCFNRYPLSRPHWEKWSEFESHSSFLASRASGTITNWEQTIPAPPNDCWLLWRSRLNSHGSVKYKLYISPTISNTEEALNTAIEVLSNSRATAFKIGRGAAGLLRPDKMVAYFNSFDDMSVAAAELGRALHGCTAQGTPFTAELNQDSLISWGVDPPSEYRNLAWYADRSWRLWITNRLAVALLSAKSSNCDGAEPWKFALQRLALSGIDLTNWSPVDADWNS